MMGAGRLLPERGAEAVGRALPVVSISLLACAALALSFAAPARASLVFDVTTTGNRPDASVGDHVCETQPLVAGNQCTLRAAIQESNAEPGADTIDFAIPGTGVKTIAPASELPAITGPVTIDGYTQGASSPNTKPLGKGDNATLLVELSGANTASQFGINGLTLEAGATGSLIKGLVINRFSGTGLLLKANSAIQGNFIGTNPGGTVAHGVTFDAIFNQSATLQIGGTAPAARNLISGNGRDAINGTGNLTVQGNYIGTQRDGKSPLGNQDSGIRIFNSNNTIGGVGAGNVIAFNGSDALPGADGITMFNPSQGNVIRRNRIFSNRDLGIDLGDDGRTPNDALDADTGPNELQNFPAITSATRASGGAITIMGQLRSAPSQQFTVEFFRSPSGNEGAIPFGETTVATDGTGLATFTFHPVGSAPVGYRITATATNQNHSTSEFSLPRKVVAG